MPRKPTVFRPAHLPSMHDQVRDYDQRRGSARQRGYSAAWDRAAAAHKALHPLCVGCTAMGRVAAADLVDHIEPHKGDARRFWNSAMWQSCCRWHHDVVKQQIEHRYDHGRASLADLRLDSAVAVALSRALLGEP